MKELFGKKNMTALKVGGLYLIFGTLWILVSDKVLHLMVEEDKMVQGAQTLKGTLFVILSSLLIFMTARHETAKRERSERELFHMEKKAKEEAIKAGEEERNRISAELHDGIQQQLAGISIMIERMKDGASGEDLDDLKEEVGNCIEEVRYVSHSLSSFRLEQKGLKKALTDLSVTDANGSPVPFELDIGILDHRSFNYFTAINIYRIAQELLLNVSKHSFAKKVELSIQEHGPDRFLFHYKENAPADKTGKEKMGIGERSIQKRIECLQGETFRDKNLGENERELAFLFCDKDLSPGLASKEKELQMS